MDLRVGPTLLERPVGRWVVMTSLVALLFVPVALDTDDFPLSTYPMYSRVRPVEVSFVTAHGVDRSDGIVTLGLDIVGATDDPLIAAGELRAAIAAGRADDRCREIATRVDRGVVVVQIVEERHDIVERTRGRPSLLDRTVIASCDVGERP